MFGIVMLLFLVLVLVLAKRQAGWPWLGGR